MTTRIRFAVQYPAKPGSGKLDLYLGFHDKTIHLADLARFHDEDFARQMVTVELIREPPDADHLPARVVRVRETITREIVE